MKLRSSRVLKRAKPRIDSGIKKQESSVKKRLSLSSDESDSGKKRSNESDSADENVEMSMKETVNTDDKGLFLGSEVLDPIIDSVVSCPKEETGEEGNNWMPVNLSETDPKDVDFEKGSENFESETFDVDTTVVNGDYGECTFMPGKDKRGSKIKNGMGSGRGSDCNEDGRAEKEKIEKDSIRVIGEKVLRSRTLTGLTMVDVGARSVVLGLRGLDEKPKTMLKCRGGPPKEHTEYKNTRLKKKREKRGRPWKFQCESTPPPLIEIPTKKLKLCVGPPKEHTEGENTRPRKKLQKHESPRKFQTEIHPPPLIETPSKKLKRCVGRPKEHTEGENTRPKKKLEKHGSPCDITPPPLIEMPTKKLKRRGRPPKVSHENPSESMKSVGVQRELHGKGIIFKKFKRRGRPPIKEAKTLATHVMKMRMKKLVSVKKGLKIQKKEGENSEPLMMEEEDNDKKVIIFGNLDRRLLKQLVRDKISNILLKSGWTIDFRQRQDRTYKDSVYVEPNGKRTHWSITRAYAKLKKKIETGNADNIELSAFTPIPEEEISMLFRHQEKVRKDKNKKRIKGKIVTCKEKKPGKKTKDEPKRKMIFKPRILARDSENVSKQGNEGVLVIKKRNLLSWMIDLGVILSGMKVRYGKTRRQASSSEGVITSDGIRCGCCNKIIGVSDFVDHCGGKIGHVFDNLYLESGTCLRNCLMDSWRKEAESINRFNVVDVLGDDPNDDTCNICGDGGNLICCDGCPSTFHQSCLDIQNFPLGDWNCIHCTCKFCGLVSVNTPQVEDSDDAITSQMLSCCLCEEKFHQSCLQEVEAENVDSSRPPFCGKKCQELFERLQSYLGVKHELEDGLSWTLLQRSDLDQDANFHDTQLKFEHNSKLAVAFSVMDECFVPIVDERSGTSIIHDVVYNCGSNFRRLNYAGFLTAVLEKGDECISAASIRIHGHRLAEMPFIGTRHMYRRQGMCHRLLDAIECTLSSLGVEELIIPAIPALLQTWTTAFGFMPLEESKKQAMKRMNLLVFPGIDILKKPLLQIQSADVDHTPFAGGVEEDAIDPEPNDENNPQLETTSSNAIDYEQPLVSTAGIVEDGTTYEQTEEATVGKNVIDHKQREKVTILVDSCSCPDLENDILTTSHGVNGLCDLNLPVKDVLTSNTDGQTSVDLDLFWDCTVEPNSMESVVSGNYQSSEMMLDVEKVKLSPLTSKLVLKNTFDLNLDPNAVETDVHIVSDDSVLCEPQACVNSFELTNSRSPIVLSADDQTDPKICESQPFGMP